MTRPRPTLTICGPSSLDSFRFGPELEMAKEYDVTGMTHSALLSRTRQRGLRLECLTIEGWTVFDYGNEQGSSSVTIAARSEHPRLFRSADADDFAAAADQLEELGWGGPVLAMLRAAAAMCSPDR